MYVTKLTPTNKLKFVMLCFILNSLGHSLTYMKLIRNKTIDNPLNRTVRNKIKSVTNPIKE